MNIQINRQEFLKHLTIGGAYAKLNRVLPILENVKIEINKDYINFESSDGENTIKHKYQTNTMQEDCVYIVVNYSDLVNYLKLIKDNNVIFEVENNNIKIIHSKGDVVYPLMDADDFPKVNYEDCNKGEALTINSNLFLEWLTKATPFISTDELRPAMTGIFFYNIDNELGCCASNSHILYTSFNKLDNNSSVNNQEWIINKNSIIPLKNICTTTDSVIISNLNKNILVEGGDTMLYIRIIDGKYPNFKAIIPKNNNIRYELSKDALKEAIMRLSIVKGASELIKFTFSDNNLNVNCENVDFAKNASENIDCVGNNNIIIGLKSSFLLNILPSIETEKIIMEMSDPNKPIVIKNNNENNDIIIIMPMQIN